VQGLPRAVRDPAVKALWRNFESQFGPTIQNFKHSCSVVEREVRAAGLQAATKHHENVESEMRHIRSITEKQESYFGGTEEQRRDVKRRPSNSHYLQINRNEICSHG
jgi:hypothetical protein